jgi:hypothetical protein
MSDDGQKPKRRSLGLRWFADNVVLPEISAAIEDDARTREEVVRQGLDRAFKYCPLCGKEDVRSYATGLISCLECGAEWEHKMSFLGSHSIKLRKPSCDGFGTNLVGTQEKPDYWQTMGLRKHKEEENKLQNALRVEVSMTQVLFCANCETQNRSESNFCSNCGNQLLKNPSAVDSSRPSGAPQAAAIERSAEPTSSSPKEMIRQTQLSELSVPVQHLTVDARPSIPPAKGGRWKHACQSSQ